MADQFAQAVLSKSVAHVALAIGQERAQKAVLDSLADIVQHYIQTIGEISVEQAEAAGRTEINIFDVLSTFRDMPAASIDWRALRDFAFTDVKKAGEMDGANWYQPFKHIEGELPSFPVDRLSRRQYGDRVGPSGGGAAAAAAAPAAAAAGAAAPRPAYLPPGLPDLPPPHTYRRTKVPAVKRSSDARQARRQRLKRQRQIQSSVRSETGSIFDGVHDDEAAQQKDILNRTTGEVEEEDEYPSGENKDGKLEGRDDKSEQGGGHIDDTPSFRARTKPVAVATPSAEEGKSATLLYTRPDETPASGMKKEDMILDGFLNEAQEGEVQQKT